MVTVGDHTAQVTQHSGFSAGRGTCQNDSSPLPPHPVNRLRRPLHLTRQTDTQRLRQTLPCGKWLHTYAYPKAACCRKIALLQRFFYSVERVTAKRKQRLLHCALPNDNAVFCRYLSPLLRQKHCTRTCRYCHRQVAAQPYLGHFFKQLRRCLPQNFRCQGRQPFQQTVYTSHVVPLLVLWCIIWHGDRFYAW